MQSQSNIVVMGVCGVGKSTIARRLAALFDGHFVEADAFHSQNNIDAMSQGIPLDDTARMGWLDRIGEAVNALNVNSNAPVFIACSALKRRYRERLDARSGICAVVFLDGDPDLIRRRMEARENHFMPTTLLTSQLDDLEIPMPSEPCAAQRFDIAEPVDEIVQKASRFCRSELSTINPTLFGAPARSGQA